MKILHSFNIGSLIPEKDVYLFSTLTLKEGMLHLEEHGNFSMLGKWQGFIENNLQKKNLEKKFTTSCIKYSSKSVVSFT